LTNFEPKLGLDRIERAPRFARGGDIGISTLLLLLLRRHDDYPPGLDRLTKHSNLCSKTPAPIRHFHIEAWALWRNKILQETTYFSIA